MNNPEMPVTLAVCACTMLRPKGLSTLLDSLEKMETPSTPARIAVIIVDNDVDGSARDIVLGRREFPHTLLYVKEERRGIPFARNAGIEAAIQWARSLDPARPDAPLDGIAFVDDDEWVTPGWLRTLHDVRGSTGAAVVTGTVEPVFAAPPPEWVVEGKFYERPRFATGTRIEYARTSNVLVDGRILTEDGLRFRRLGMQGGSDTHFFNEVIARGHDIVWADEAVVFEEVPESRVSPRWLIARHYRYGLVRSASLRASGGSFSRCARRGVNGVLTTARGVLRLALARGRARRVRAAQEVAQGAGLVLGLFGATYDDYKTVHGS